MFNKVIVEIEFHGKKIPVKFLNFDEFNCSLESLHYDILYKAMYVTNILGNESFPNSGLPKDHRISFSKNVVYKAK